MPAGFPDGWDLADPLPAGWTVERLHALLEAAPPWTPDAESVRSDAAVRVMP